MNYKSLLDTSIVDSMPPFPPIDEIIGRERRHHRRQLTAAGGAALVVVGLVVGTAILRPATGERSGDPRPPITTAGPSQGPETDQQTAARLEAALRARLAIVAPGATLSPDSPQAAADEPLLQAGGGGFDGFRSFSGQVTVTTDAGTARITVIAMRPETPQQTDTGALTRVFGGCAGLGYGVVAQVESCTEETDPSGARITRATRGYGSAVGYEVKVIFPDGSAVTGETLPAPVSEAVFTTDQLAALLSDPALIP